MVLGDERGRILAQAEGGPSNHTEEPGGPERLRSVLRALLKEILNTPSRELRGRVEWEAACCGMTGELEIKRRVIRGLLHSRHLSVVHDSVNALEGATVGAAGIIVIGGTGSVARGRNGKGLELTMGGWGHGFGDEGSGYWIGREVVRAVLAQWDQMGARTRLSSMLLRRLSIQSPYELIRRYYAGTFSRDQLAGLAAWADEAAEAGDLVAREILTRAGLELGRLAKALAKRLFGRPQSKTSPKRHAFSVHYSGGVFGSARVLASFTDCVRASFPTCVVSPPQLSPLLGSLLLAYRSSKVNVDAVVGSWPGQVKRLAG